LYRNPWLTKKKHENCYIKICCVQLNSKILCLPKIKKGISYFCVITKLIFNQNKEVFVVQKCILFKLMLFFVSDI
jgi:hypothetical protein